MAQSAADAVQALGAELLSHLAVLGSAPSSAAALQATTAYCEAFIHHPQAFDVARLILESPATDTASRLYALTLVYHSVQKHGGRGDVTLQEAVINVLGNAIREPNESIGVAAEERSILVKAGMVLGELVEREFPQKWPSMVNDVLKLLSAGGCHALVVSYMFHDVGEDCTDSSFNSRIAPGRRSDLLQGLAATASEWCPPLLALRAISLQMLGSTDPSLVEHAALLPVSLQAAFQDVSQARILAERFLPATLEMFAMFCSFMPAEWLEASQLLPALTASWECACGVSGVLQRNLCQSILHSYSYLVFHHHKQVQTEKVDVMREAKLIDGLMRMVQQVQSTGWAVPEPRMEMSVETFQACVSTLCQLSKTSVRTICKAAFKSTGASPAAGSPTSEDIQNLLRDFVSTLQALARHPSLLVRLAAISALHTVIQALGIQQHEERGWFTPEVATSVLADVSASFIRPAASSRYHLSRMMYNPRLPAADREAMRKSIAARIVEASPAERMLLDVDFASNKEMEMCHSEIRQECKAICKALVGLFPVVIVPAAVTEIETCVAAACGVQASGSEWDVMCHYAFTSLMQATKLLVPIVLQASYMLQVPQPGSGMSYDVVLRTSMARMLAALIQHPGTQASAAFRFHVIDNLDSFLPVLQWNPELVGDVVQCIFTSMQKSDIPPEAENTAPILFASQCKAAAALFQLTKKSRVPLGSLLAPMVEAAGTLVATASLSMEAELLLFRALASACAAADEEPARDALLQSLFSYPMATLTSSDCATSLAVETVGGIPLSDDAGTQRLVEVVTGVGRAAPLLLALLRDFPPSSHPVAGATIEQVGPLCLAWAARFNAWWTWTIYEGCLAPLPTDQQPSVLSALGRFAYTVSPHSLRLLLAKISVVEDDADVGEEAVISEGGPIELPTMRWEGDGVTRGPSQIIELTRISTQLAQAFATAFGGIFHDKIALLHCMFPQSPASYLEPITNVAAWEACASALCGQIDCTFPSSAAGAATATPALDVAMRCVQALEGGELPLYLQLDVLKFIVIPAISVAASKEPTVALPIIDAMAKVMGASLSACASMQSMPAGDTTLWRCFGILPAGWELSEETIELLIGHVIANVQAEIAESCANMLTSASNKASKAHFFRDDADDDRMSVQVSSDFSAGAGLSSLAATAPDAEFDTTAEVYQLGAAALMFSRPYVELVEHVVVLLSASKLDQAPARLLHCIYRSMTSVMHVIRWRATSSIASLQPICDELLGRLVSVCHGVYAAGVNGLVQGKLDDDSRLTDLLLLWYDICIAYLGTEASSSVRQALESLPGVADSDLNALDAAVGVSAAAPGRRGRAKALRNILRAAAAARNAAAGPKSETGVRAAIPTLAERLTIQKPTRAPDDPLDDGQSLARLFSDDDL